MRAVLLPKVLKAITGALSSLSERSNSIFILNTEDILVLHCQKLVIKNI